MGFCYDRTYKTLVKPGLTVHSLNGTIKYRDGLKTHWNSNIIITYVGQRLCKNVVLHRHMCIVFLPSPTNRNFF